MTTIELRFLTNRYHGTAWGRHVNEGVAEWPPSPYRLLRAMYDAWKRKCTGLSEKEVGELFVALAGRQPIFWLPKVVSAHTRSYLSSNTEDRSDKSLIFDAFVALHPNASCFIEWDVALDPEERRSLSELLSSLNYLGRSESWVEARLAHAASGIKCAPVAETSSSEDVAYVACPVPPAQYRGKWAWLDALSYSTGRILKEKLSGPPAMQYVPYALDPNAVTTWLPARMRPLEKRFSAAVLELHGHVLPTTTETVRIAERVRARLMRYFEMLHGAASIPAMVHGKDENGIPLKDHTHLFILPQTDRSGRIDHILISTRAERFPDAIADAIVNLKSLVWAEPLRVTPAWMGKADDPRIRPLSRTVVSSTPFITVRHWRKGRGTELEFLKQEVRRECRNHQLPEPIHIEQLDCIGQLPPSAFRRNRTSEPSRKGAAFRLQFAEPVAAPFSLGYACHFGLGQFKKA